MLRQLPKELEREHKTTMMNVICHDYIPAVTLKAIF